MNKNVFGWTNICVSVYETFGTCVHRKEIGIKYGTVVALATFDNKTVNKISVKF